MGLTYRFCKKWWWARPSQDLQSWFGLGLKNPLLFPSIAILFLFIILYYASSIFRPSWFSLLFCNFHVLGSVGNNHSHCRNTIIPFVEKTRFSFFFIISIWLVLYHLFLSLTFESNHQILFLVRIVDCQNLLLKLQVLSIIDHIYPYYMLMEI